MIESVSSSITSEETDLLIFDSETLQDGKENVE